MKLFDLKIGDKFKLSKNGMVWIKKTVQGLNNNYSYCESVDLIQTKNPSLKTQWGKLFNQNVEIIKDE